VHRFRNILAAMIAAAVMSLGFSIATAGPAAADATGCQFSGGGNINGQYFPAREWCASVSGSGTYVRGTSGSFNSPWGNICNYRVRLRFIDGTNGAVYRVVDYGTNWRCDHAAFLSFPGLNYTARKGKIEIQLLSNGSVVSTVGHSIK
jgi:hypothetical protein